MLQCTTHGRHGRPKGNVLHTHDDVFGERYGTLWNFITGMIERNNYGEWYIALNYKDCNL